MTNEQLYILLSSLHRQLETAIDAARQELPPDARVIVTVDEQMRAARGMAIRELLRDRETFPALDSLQEVINKLAEDIEVLKAPPCKS